ncbi:PACE efflux transporter [Vibrio sp.]|nr:PACE efflux transporter [Vibrio sp.]
MKTQERILHAALFEAGALALIALGTALFTDQNPFKIGAIGLALSLVAMVWNYVFNSIFDRFVPGERLQRTKLTRLVHAGAFEGGMLLLTIPVLMVFLNKGLMDVLLLSIGSAVFFVVYTIIFNYSYDVVDAKMKAKKSNNSAA